MFCLSSDSNEAGKSAAQKDDRPGNGDTFCVRDDLVQVKQFRISKRQMKPFLLRVGSYCEIPYVYILSGADSREELESRIGNQSVLVWEE